MINMSGPGSGRFAFLDAGETARRLGIDRITLDQWVRDGRLKAYKGVGRDSFFKAAEVDSLYKSLHPDAALAKAIADDELDSANAGATAQPMQLTVRKKQDPQMRVYLRLQAVYQSLKDQHVHFSLPPQKQSSGVTLAVCNDPDGLGITLQQR